MSSFYQHFMIQDILQETINLFQISHSPWKVMAFGENGFGMGFRLKLTFALSGTLLHGTYSTEEFSIALTKLQHTIELHVSDADFDPSGTKCQFVPLVCLEWRWCQLWSQKVYCSNLQITPATKFAFTDLIGVKAREWNTHLGSLSHKLILFQSNYFKRTMLSVCFEHHWLSISPNFHSGRRQGSFCTHRRRK